MKKSSSIPSNSSASDSITRRRFLKLSAGATAAAATISSQFIGLVTQNAKAGQLPSQKNILLLITDQERPVMWFPDGWEAANLPNMTRLKNNGLTFNQAFCSTAQCSPSRNTIFTGLFPAQHGSVDTLTTYTPQDLIEHQLDPSLPNLATCLKEAGYDVFYKGKWHMSTEVDSADGTVISDDISRYGFDQWDPPDAGGDTAPANFGGGTANNDQRFINDAVALLQDRIANPSSKPFCLVVSLVNPHDVLAYPNSYNSGGYPDDPWLNPTTPPIGLPPTVTENLATNKKPTAQEQVLAAMALGLGPLPTDEMKTNYLSFYANLMKYVDGQIGQLLSVFDNGGGAGQQLLNDTLIVRMSDHGEMGMCHDGLRQKTFVCYEETLRVPLVWSNPELFPATRTTNAMVSHVDFLPTICALAGVPNWQAKGFKGIDYSSIILDANASPVQSFVLFTFDDIYAGQNRLNSPNGVASPPNRIQMIRTSDFKYARYYDAAGIQPDQVEFYDLSPDGGDYDATFQQPLELKNLSPWALGDNFPGALTDEQLTNWQLLEFDLANQVNQRLQPRSPDAPVGPENLKVQVVRWTDDAGPHTQVQITFLSRFNEMYQLQQSSDLLNWSYLDEPIPGNNGLVLRHYDLTAPQAFYRIQWWANS